MIDEDFEKKKLKQLQKEREIQQQEFEEESLLMGDTDEIESRCQHLLATII